MYLTLDTANAKVVGAPRRGYAAALTLPIAQTCPRSCAVRDVCYARGGKLAIHVRRLEAAAGDASAIAVTRAAAREICDAAARGLARGRVLRLFQAGDARTRAAARHLSVAAATWRAHGGAEVWGYTHAWRDVPRDVWRDVAILASVESVDGAREARARGYVPARIVPEHPADGRAWVEGGIRWIPCPEQTRGVPCVACRLCLDTDRLADRGAGIAFAAHGSGRKRLARRLPIVK